MADGFDFKIEGAEALQRRLKGVTEDMQFKGGRFALRKAANLVRDAAKENASRLDDPQTAENISENIAVRWSSRTFRRTGNLAFRVGVLGGARQYANTRENVRKGRAGKTFLTAGSKGNPGGDTWYWRLLEFGTEKMPAQPFMRPALSRNAQRATDEFVTQYNRALDRYLRKQRK